MITETNYQRLQDLSEGRAFTRPYEDLRAEYEAQQRQYEENRRPFAVTADVPYTDVWDFPTVQAYPGKHECEKPQELLRHIIKASSRPGAVVLDTFCGGGSTGEAVLTVGGGRRFIGCDKSDHWADYSRRRCEVIASGGTWREVAARMPKQPKTQTKPNIETEAAPAIQQARLF